MQKHRSSCLAGPTFRSRGWWQTLEDGLSHAQDALPTPKVLEDDDPHFRADLVVRVRREIAAGTYGTEEQFEIALGRLLRHLDEMG